MVINIGQILGAEFQGPDLFPQGTTGEEGLHRQNQTVYVSNNGHVLSFLQTGTHAVPTCLNTQPQPSSHESPPFF